MSVYIKLFMLVDMIKISIIGFLAFSCSVDLFLPQEYVRPWKTEVFSAYMYKTPNVSSFERFQAVSKCFLL